MEHLQTIVYHGLMALAQREDFSRLDSGENWPQQAAEMAVDGVTSQKPELLGALDEYQAKLAIDTTTRMTLNYLLERRLTSPGWTSSAAAYMNVSAINEFAEAALLENIASAKDGALSRPFRAQQMDTPKPNESLAGRLRQKLGRGRLTAPDALDRLPHLR